MSALTVADVLDRAADLIEPEGAWTQAAFARGRSGAKVKATGRSAVCWCAVGAIKRVVDVEYVGSAPVWNAASAPFGTTNALSLWNDAPKRTQPEVVAKLREAAALAREQGNV